MAWMHYEYTASYPKFYYDINYTTSRSGGQVTINFDIAATISGFANILGPVVLQVGYWNGSTDTQVTIKARSGDNWANSTRHKSCSLTFTDYGTNKGFYVRVANGDLSNAYMPQQYGTAYYAGITPPSAPSWMSASPNPAEVNTQYLVSWGAGGAGSLPVAGYDVLVRGWNGSAWTDWLTIRNALNSTSILEPAPKNMNVYGVTGAPGIKYQYAVRTTDNVVSTSGWVYSPEITIAFISPTSPSQITFNPSKGIKKTASVSVNWTQGVGGSGTITNYGLSFRVFSKATQTWSNWTSNTNINALNYLWTPITTFPSLANGDIIQAKVLTNNNWGFSSSYVNSANLPIKGNIARISINGNWYESTSFICINGNWYEATPYVSVNGNWYESI